MAIDIYLKLMGPDVKGESLDADMKDAIELQSWQWGHDVTFDMQTAKTGGRINVHPINFQKDVDKSSPILIQKMQENEAFDDAQIIVRKTEPGGHFNHYVINLKNVRVVSLQSSVSAGMEKIQESGTMVASWYEIVYQAEAATGGKEGGEIKTEYNLLEHKT